MCTVLHQSITKTLLICTNCKGKDKYANGTFLEHCYAHEIRQDENIVKEVIWSDRPTSEFKNKFIKQSLENLSKKKKQATCLEIHCNLPWSHCLLLCYE